MSQTIFRKLKNDEGIRPVAVVVNDDPTQLNILARLLERAGIGTRVFECAEAALAAMSPADPPDLVVTDIYMPGIDGWRFCRLLRSPEYAAFNEIPVLVVSATFAGDHPERITADIGADAFLPSPVDGNEFIAQTRALLAGKAARRQPRALVLEDDPDLTARLKEAFTTHGYRTDTALTTREAQEAFSNAPYDVAVLDHRLPDGTGDQLLYAFRTGQPDCVCLMMTTDPTPELALSWMKQGAAAYLRKPFDPEYLIGECARARRERALLRVQDLLEERTRELQEARQRFERVFYHHPLPMALTSISDRQIFDINNAFVMTTGYTREEVIGRTSADLALFSNPEEQAHVSDKLKRDGSISGIELQIRRKDGTVRDGLFWGEIISSHGHPFMLTLMSDITGLKHAEAALFDSEARYRRLAENVPAIIYQFRMTHDGEFSFPYISDAVERVIGIPSADVERDASILLGMIHPDERDPFRKGVLESARAIAPYRAIIRLVKNGRDLWLECRSTPEKQPDGSVLWDGVIVDVTKEHKNREKLRLQSLVLDQINDHVTITDLEGKIIWVNQAQERILALDQNQLIGQSTRVYGENPEKGATQREILESTLRDGAWSGEVFNRHADGHEVVMNCRTQVVKDQAGKPVCLVGIAEDIAAG